MNRRFLKLAASMPLPAPGGALYAGLLFMTFPQGLSDRAGIVKNRFCRICRNKVNGRRFYFARWQIMLYATFFLKWVDLSPLKCKLNPGYNV
jgi:hypothetical protein